MVHQLPHKSINDRLSSTDALQIGLGIFMVARALTRSYNVGSEAKSGEGRDLLTSDVCAGAGSASTSIERD